MKNFLRLKRILNINEFIKNKDENKEFIKRKKEIDEKKEKEKEKYYSEIEIRDFLKTLKKI